MDSNRRSESRVRTRIPVKVANEADFHDHFVHDLSRGGLFVVSDKLQAIGSEIDVDLFPPGWADPLELHGIVVRVADDEASRALGRAGMGIKLDAVPEWTRSRLDALIQQAQANKPSKQPPKEPTFELLPPAPVAAAPPAPPPPAPAAPPPPAPKPAAIVLAPEEYHEARLAELESKLAANADHVRKAEQESAEAKAQVERVRKEKDALEAQLRLQTERLEEELNAMRASMKRRWVMPVLLLLGIGAAGGYVYTHPSLLDRYKTELPAPPPIAARAVDAGRPDAAVAIEPGAPDAGNATTTASTPAPADAGAEAADAGAAEVASAELGTLSVKADGRAMVVVDGETVAKAPLKAYPLSAGTHKVRLDCKVDGKRVKGKKRTVKIKAGKDTELEIDCTPEAEDGEAP